MRYVLHYRHGLYVWTYKQKLQSSCAPDQHNIQCFIPVFCLVSVFILQSCVVQTRGYSEKRYFVKHYYYYLYQKDYYSGIVLSARVFAVCLFLEVHLLCNQIVLITYSLPHSLRSSLGFSSKSPKTQNGSLFCWLQQ